MAKLHLNFDTGPRYDLGRPLQPIPNAPRKIKFGKKSHEGPGPKTTDDHSALIINGVTVYGNLPDIHYKVNGRTPIGWFVDRYGYRSDSTTGITNYPLEGKSGEEVQRRHRAGSHTWVWNRTASYQTLPEEFEMDVEPEPPGLDRYAKAAV